jgi:hypothetical protein
MRIARGNLNEMNRRWISLFLMPVVFAAKAGEGTPGPIPPEVRETFGLDVFYQKFVNAGGMPIVGSAKVNDAALAECAWIVNRMLEHRPEILKALAGGKVRFAIMAATEYTTHIPEHADLKPRVYWDRRARGLGATPSSPAVSGGEENLLGFPGDPYPREIICIHEFGHAIHGVAMKALDASFDTRLRAAYKAATDAGLWKGTYAGSNYHEYWAEGVQDWFDNNDAGNALHNDINTREKLKTYDPALAALCAEVFGDLPWRYRKPADRSPEDREHLGGYDPAKAPRFRWRVEVVPERPRARLDCAQGTVELEFSGPRESLALLLAQIHEGYYSGGGMVFGGDGFTLSPAQNTPDGGRVPEGEGRWTMRLGSQQVERGLGASIVKGEEIFAKIVRDAGEKILRVQRIVRLN